MSKKYTLCKFTTGNVNDNIQVELNLHLFSRDYAIIFFGLSFNFILTVCQYGDVNKPLNWIEFCFHHQYQCINIDWICTKTKKRKVIHKYLYSRVENNTVVFILPYLISINYSAMVNIHVCACIVSQLPVHVYVWPI